MKLHSRIYGWKFVWMEFAEEFKASVNDPDPDSSHTEMSMIVPVQDTSWMLIYNMHPGSKGKHDQTSIHAAYVPVGDFKFAVHPETWLDGFGKLMGMQDINIGHADFDKAFLIKGNDENKVKELFDDAVIRRLMMDEPTIQVWAHCENTDSSPTSNVLRPDQNILSLRLKGAVDDFERLRALYQLKHRILQRLCQIGAAEMAMV